MVFSKQVKADSSLPPFSVMVSEFSVIVPVPLHRVHFRFTWSQWSFAGGVILEELQMPIIGARAVCSFSAAGW